MLVGWLALALPAAAAPKDDPPPDWAFVVAKVLPGSPFKGTVTVPGSALRIDAKVLDDPAREPDWFPQDHATMPDVVAHGRPPKLFACAFCHLPNGVGGPDSAAITGLSASYIEREFAEFRSGRRGCAIPKGAQCSGAMHDEAAAVMADELKAAAAYFASQTYVSRIKVVEAATVPKTKVEFYSLVRDGTGSEPIGNRILEVPDDARLFWLGDWRAPVIAYVPPGSIARGRALVESGDGAAPCAVCHGAKLQGSAIAPPLAGRSPTYIVRQLYNMQHGFRTGPAVAQMLPEVAHMTPSDRIAIAAYLASMK
ncbi:MAG: c-type cytochrome [Proteobacteria bacterium]|nr:c-type cytochrome [Pseudomonadota bacterium]